MYARNTKIVNTNNKNMKMPLQEKRAYKCKVCFDAGKPESLYNNHFVRQTPDINSKVVCPTLLSLVCFYCQKKGHTPSRCLKRERDESTQSTKPNSVSYNDTDSMSTWTTKSSKSQYRSPTNLYSLLCANVENDDDEHESVLTIDTPIIDSTAVSKSPYLLALMKPKQAPIIEVSLSSQYDYPIIVKNQQNKDTEITSLNKKKPFFSKRWSDYDDSDSDSD